jgi:hypothetical protein
MPQPFIYIFIKIGILYQYPPGAFNFRMGLKSHAGTCDRAYGSGEYKDLYLY